MMCARAAEWIYEREVSHQPKELVVGARDRPQLERRRISLGLMPHVIALDVAAEMHLRARARIFVVAGRQLGRTKVLPDLEPLQDSVGGLDGLVNLVNVQLAFRELPGRRRGRIRMQFDLQMTGRRRVRVVNLDFVKVDRQRRARSREYRDNT